MTEAARLARAAELSRLAELVAAGAAEAASYRGGPLLTGLLPKEDPDSLVGWLDAFRTRPERALLAGTLDGAIVGVAAARAGVDPPVGTVDVLFVEKEARGVGVGAALMDACIEWLRGVGCVGVDVQALPGARDTKQFLEGSGLTARLIVMHRSIG